MTIQFRSILDLAPASLVATVESLRTTAAAATDRKRPVVITRYASASVFS